MRLIRVFISSPGDVNEERDLARRVIERLSTEFSSRFVIEPVFWEDEPLRSTDTFQKDVPSPAECDVFVCVLWSRLGTLLPESYRREDGSRYESGTEWEFETALEAFDRRGAPDILFYRKTARRLIDLDVDDAQMQELRRQRTRVQAFVDRWFGPAEDGSLPRAFSQFERPDSFERMLREHLSRLLDRRDIGTELAQRPARARWTGGSPFRGLEAFTEDHGAAFFGRSTAIFDVIELLRRRARDRCPFVLVLGASGSGKSSLVRAGVTPLISGSGVVEGATAWRHGVARPGSDPCLALATALLSEGCLPELASSMPTPAELAHALRADPTRTAGMVQGTLARVDDGHTMLFLVIDQFEEALSGRFADDAEPFAEALTALVETGQVWIAATLRSDFYAEFVAVPALADLKGSDGQFDLLPPSAADIAEIIRRPAEIAGLMYEERATGERLDDMLLNAAVHSSNSLPILQFALQRLYEDREGDMLTIDAYEAFGGLDGAVAGRAEAVFAALEASAQGAMADVIRLVVTTSHQGVTTFVRCWAPLSLCREVPGGAAFTDAFLKSRLLVSDRRAQDGSVVTVAHESLFEHWPRLREFLNQDRRLIHARRRLANAAREWHDVGRPPDMLLPAGRPLEDAADVLDAFGRSLNEVERAFVEASQAKFVTATRIRRGVVSAIVILVFSSVFAGFFAISESGKAARKTLAQQTSSLFGMAQRHARTDPGLMRLYLRELEDPISEDWRAAEVWRMLQQSSDSLLHRFRSVPLGTPHAYRYVSAGAWSADGALLATCNGEFLLKIWAVSEADPLLIEYRGDTADTVEDIRDMAWHPLTQTLAFSSGGTVKLWTRGQNGPVDIGLNGSSVQWSPDGRWLASYGEDRAVRVWDDSTRTDSVSLHSDAHVLGITFDPDGRLWVATEGRLRAHEFDGAGWIAGDTISLSVAEGLPIVWSPDGRYLAAGTDGGFAIWDANERTARDFTIEYEYGFAPGETIAWHPDAPWLSVGGAFSHIALWRSDEPTGVSRIEVPFEWSNDVRWNRDGTILSACMDAGDDLEDDGAVLMWSADQIWHSPSTPERIEGAVSREPGALWHPISSDVFATVSKQGEIRIWRAGTHALPMTIGQHPGSDKLAWLDDDTLLTGSETVESIWQVRAGATASSRGSLTYDKDGANITVSVAGGVRTRDVGATPLHVIGGQTVTAWDESHTRVAFALGSGDVGIWNPTNDTYDDIDLDLVEPAQYLFWSSTGRYLALINSRDVVICEIETGTAIHTFELEQTVFDVAWFADDSRVAVLSYDACSIWQLAKPRRPQYVYTSLGWNDIDVNQSGTLVIAGRRGMMMSLQPGQHAVPSRVYPRPALDEIRLTEVAWAPDGRRVASLDAEGTIQVWLPSWSLMREHLWTCTSAELFDDEREAIELPDRSGPVPNVLDGDRLRARPIVRSGERP